MTTDTTFDPLASANPSDPDSIDLLDVVLALARRKAFIVLSTVAGILAAVAVALLLPNTYTATSVIMLPQQSQSAASMVIGQLGPLAGLAGRDLGLKNPADLYVGLLGSRTIADKLVDRFHLRDVYHVKTSTDARKKLASHSTIDAGKDSLIRISVADRDPGRAAGMANAFVEELHQQNSSLALTESAQRRLFFEQQLETEKNALADAETALKNSEQRTGVLQVNSQAEVAIESVARLRAEIMAREVTLQRLDAGATAQNPEVVRVQAELKELRSQLDTLEAGSGTRRQGDPLIPPSGMPGAGLEYVRQLRQVKYHETLFDLLAKEYETARIDESREAPVIQVVDRAAPPEKKSGPPRTLIVLAGALLSSCLACTWVLIRWRLGEPGEARKVAMILQSLGASKRPE